MIAAAPKMCVVEEFDLELAEFITGKSGVSVLIEKSRDTGNFLFQDNGIVTNCKG